MDEIYAVPRNECHLWEDPNAPMFIRAEQPQAASLSVLLAAYAYFGYTFQRYPSGAMGKVGGPGCVTPVFSGLTQSRISQQSRRSVGTPKRSRGALWGDRAIRRLASAMELPMVRR